jgi:hypothetical protein
MKHKTYMNIGTFESLDGPKCYQSVYSEGATEPNPLKTVELRRFELLTSSMRTKRSTN